MFSLLRSWLTCCNKWLVFVLSATLFENLIELAIPFALADFIDNVLLPKEHMLVLKYCKAFCFLIVIEIVIQYASAILSTKLITRVIAYAEQDMLGTVVKFPFSFFRNKQSGYLADRINRDIYDLTMFAVNSCVMIVTGLLSLIGSFSYLFFVDITYLIIFFVMITVYVVFYYLIKNRLQYLSFENRENESNFFNIIVNVISFIKPIKIHELYDIYAEQLKDKFETWYDVNVKREKLSYWFASSRNITGRVFLLINFLYGGTQVINGNLAVGQFVAINTYFLLALSGATSFLNLAQNYQNALAAYKRIDALKQQTVETFGDSNLVEPLEDVNVQDLSYSINGKQIIKSFSYRFEKGNIYCLVGENGAGKSTLFNLLVGLIRPDSGNILFNGKPLISYNIKRLRKQIIGFAEQESFVCEPLVLDNKLNWKLLSKFHIELESIKAVDNFSNNLSGGEKQKLGLLQFLNPKAQLLLLDEPTAALDIVDSKCLWDYLMEIKNQSIIIVITHKHDELRYADKVINLSFV